MTTDQCARCGGHRKVLTADFDGEPFMPCPVCQPIPTSSLEEARVQVMRAMGFDERIARRAGTEEEQEAWAEYAASARAEVIREVETAVYELGRIEHLCVVDTNTALKPEERAYVAMCVANARTALRALSQGGEGKT